MKKHILGYSVIVFISAALGIGYGFNSGIENYYHLERLPATLVVSSNYRHVANGDSTAHLEWIRGDTETALDSYLWYEENGNRFLSNIFLEEYLDSREKYVNELIEYVKLTPAPRNLSEILHDDEARERYMDGVKKRNTFLLSRGVPLAALTKVASCRGKSEVLG
ncbi:MAG: hypothetical protein ACI93R_003811 [Flavobacteriales bacterium]|jgi:hypothetical protein